MEPPRLRADDPRSVLEFAGQTPAGAPVISLRRSGSLSGHRNALADVGEQRILASKGTSALESRAELHDVRDFLGHTNLTTTSCYLRSTAMRLERALRLLEESQAASERTPPMVREGDSCSSATAVPHAAIWAYDVDDAPDADTLDAIAVGMVSPVGIEPTNNRLRDIGRAIARRRRSRFTE